MRPGSDHTTGRQITRVVGRIGRPHGLRGEVAVQVRTDFPEQRFAVGALLSGDAGLTLTVETVRPHSGALLVRFAGVADRDAAAQLSGLVLTADVTARPELDDPDEVHDHQPAGLADVGSARTARGPVRGGPVPPAPRAGPAGEGAPGVVRGRAAGHRARARSIFRWGEWT